MTKAAVDQPAIRRGRKYEQVLEGARQVFMANGFEGASVDEIARVAGVSKATLYKYFSDKQILFTEVAKTECQRQATTATDSIEMAAPPRTVLAQAGRHFLCFMTSQLGQQIFRISVAESDRFPELGRRFYETGPAVMRTEMVAYFAEACARGELSISDHVLAADQFAELCKADLFMRMIFGVIETVDSADIDRVVDSAVDTFLARYGT